jgi:SAM-dependent methyltransferase
MKPLLLKFCALLLGSGLVFCGGAGSQPLQVLPDLPYVPTPPEVVAEMIQMARITPDDVIYDLGCGDGRIVITAARKFGARGVGVDIDPELVKESQENARKAGVADRVNFFERDLFQTDLREATVLTLYLLPELNLLLRPKIFQELRPGARILSHDFDMGEWKPDQTAVVPNARYFFEGKFSHQRDARIYYWVMPADAAGSWRWRIPAPGGEQEVRLQLSQKFQEITGKVTIGRAEGALEDLRLSGDRIRFTVVHEAGGGKETLRFQGRISGNTLQGRVEAQGGPAPVPPVWTAKREPSPKP